MEKRIAVFCSASYHIDAQYNEAAREVVRALCSLDYTLVSGGCVKGTMGVIADECQRLGGCHVGVVPRFMEPLRHPGLTRTVWTETMAERKEAMRAQTVGVIALPGGVGTLDELIETHVLAKLGRYEGRLLVLNIGGFYDPFKALLDHYTRTGMLDEASRDLIRFPATVEELVKQLP